MKKKPAKRSRKPKSDSVTDKIKAIREAHSLGQEILKEAPEYHGYGSDAIGKIAKDKKVSIEVARKRREFAREYTKKEVAELTRLMKKHKYAFGLSFIDRLLSAPTKIKRKRLQERAIEERWSRQQLNREIRIRYGTRRQGGKLPITKSKKGFMAEVESVAIKMRRLIEANQLEDKEGEISLDHLELEENTHKQIRSVHRAVSRLLRQVQKIPE